MSGSPSFMTTHSSTGRIVSGSCSISFVIVQTIASPRATVTLTDGPLASATTAPAPPPVRQTIVTW